MLLRITTDVAGPLEMASVTVQIGAMIPIMLELSLKAAALKDLTGIPRHQLCQVLLDGLSQDCMSPLAAIMIREHRAHTCQAIDQKDLFLSRLSRVATSASHKQVWSAPFCCAYMLKQACTVPAGHLSELQMQSSTSYAGCHVVADLV